MRLKYIVPTLGLAAAATTPIAAADVQIGGYVDSILAIQNFGDNIAPAGNDGDPDNLQVDFSASADLDVDVEISADVRARVELMLMDSMTDLQEAYVEWNVQPTVALTMGKFHNHLGYEGLDAPELHRVNQSVVFQDMTGVDVTGLGVGIKVNDDADVGVYLVDDFFGDAASKEGADLGVGAAVTYRVDGIGFFDVDLAYDMGAVADGSDNSDIIHFGVNGEIDTLQESQGLTFGFDIMYQDHDAFTKLGGMGMANYKLGTSFPASATLMLSYLEPNDETDDDELIEVAVALLTQPTNDQNFNVNVEVQYVQNAADDSDVFGLFVEALAIIP